MGKVCVDEAQFSASGADSSPECMPGALTGAWNRQPCSSEHSQISPSTRQNRESSRLRVNRECLYANRLNSMTLNNTQAVADKFTVDVLVGGVILCVLHSPDVRTWA